MFQEGNHYKVLKLPPSSQLTATERFSIYCPGCYQWEKDPLIHLKEWLAQHNIVFKQVHMDFMGAYGKQATMALAMTHGTQSYDAIKQALFNYIHVERRGDWQNDNGFFQTLETAGLKQSDFKVNQNNLQVMKTVLDWNQYGDYIHVAPSFLVNNRYLINMGGLKPYDDLRALITYLTQLQ
nr:thioredoxin domain-containing protein [Endozoicomonas sp. ONNA2]